MMLHGVKHLRAIRPLNVDALLTYYIRALETLPSSILSATLLTYFYLSLYIPHSRSFHTVYPLFLTYPTSLEIV